MKLEYIHSNRMCILKWDVRREYWFDWVILNRDRLSECRFNKRPWWGNRQNVIRRWLEQKFTPSSPSDISIDALTTVMYRRRQHPPFNIKEMHVYRQFSIIIHSCYYNCERTRLSLLSATISILAASTTPTPSTQLNTYSFLLGSPSAG